MTIYTDFKVEGTRIEDPLNTTVTAAIGDNNTSSVLTMRLRNTDGRHATDISVGDEIVARAGKTSPGSANDKIFTGIVTEKKFKDTQSREFLTITARDFTNALQKTTVEPSVYTSQEISAIVLDLMEDFGPDGITVNNVNSTGITLNRIVFKQISLFDAIKQLAELATNFFFYVDVDKDLHFEMKGTTSSGLTLNNTNTFKSTVTRDIESVSNKIYVYGARQLTANPQESFTSDGTATYQLDNKPHNTRLQVGGVDKVGAIYNTNIEPPSGTDYAVNFEDKQVVFVSGTDLGYSSIPSSGTAFTVDFDVSRPIIKLAADNTSITAYKERTKVIIDENITDPDIARDIAINQLTLNKDPKLQGNVTVQGIATAQPGNTAIADYPNQNINTETLDIIQVTYTFNTKNNFEETALTIKLSQRVRDVTDVLKDLITSIRRINANQLQDDDILSRLVLQEQTIKYVPMWINFSRSVGDSFIVGHALNGQLGSPQIGVGGGQVVLGDQRGIKTVIASETNQFILNNSVNGQLGSVTSQVPSELVVLG